MQGCKLGLEAFLKKIKELDSGLIRIVKGNLRRLIRHIERRDLKRRDRISIWKSWRSGVMLSAEKSAIRRKCTPVIKKVKVELVKDEIGKMQIRDLEATRPLGLFGLMLQESPISSANVTKESL